MCMTMLIASVLTGMGGQAAVEPLAEYAWTAAWSMGAPEFSLPAGEGSTKDIVLSWNEAIGSIDTNSVAIFVNDQTGEICPVQETFDYAPE